MDLVVLDSISIEGGGVKPVGVRLVIEFLQVKGWQGREKNSLSHLGVKE